MSPLWHSSHPPPMACQITPPHVSSPSQLGSGRGSGARAARALCLLPTQPSPTGAGSHHVTDLLYSLPIHYQPEPAKTFPLHRGAGGDPIPQLGAPWAVGLRATPESRPGAPPTTSPSWRQPGPSWTCCSPRQCVAGTTAAWPASPGPHGLQPALPAGPRTATSSPEGSPRPQSASRQDPGRLSHQDSLPWAETAGLVRERSWTKLPARPHRHPFPLPGDLWTWRTLPQLDGLMLGAQRPGGPVDSPRSASSFIGRLHRRDLPIEARCRATPRLPRLRATPEDKPQSQPCLHVMDVSWRPSPASRGWAALPAPGPKTRSLDGSCRDR